MSVAGGKTRILHTRLLPSAGQNRLLPPRDSAVTGSGLGSHRRSRRNSSLLSATGPAARKGRLWLNIEELMPIVL